MYQHAAQSLPVDHIYQNQVISKAQSISAVAPPLKQRGEVTRAASPNHGGSACSFSPRPEATAEGGTRRCWAGLGWASGCQGPPASEASQSSQRNARCNNTHPHEGKTQLGFAAANLANSLMQLWAPAARRRAINQHQRECRPAPTRSLPGLLAPARMLSLLRILAGVDAQHARQQLHRGSCLQQYRRLAAAQSSSSIGATARRPRNDTCNIHPSVRQSPGRLLGLDGEDGVHSRGVVSPGGAEGALGRAAVLGDGAVAADGAHAR